MKTFDQQSAIQIRVLEMLVQKLQIANWGNLFLVFVIAWFVWGRVPQTYIIPWLVVNILVVLARVQFIYRRYKRTEINAENVSNWLLAFCISLGTTNLLWSVALPVMANSGDPKLIIVAMFCFFVVIASGIATLAMHMPAFFSHGLALVVPVALYFFIAQHDGYRLYGMAVIIFYAVASMLAASSNRNFLTLFDLQSEQLKLVKDLEIKTQAAEAALDEKNRFLAAASHDLRQPLHSAGLLVSSLKKNINTKPAIDILHDIDKSISALGHSFNGLLDMSKLDAGAVRVSHSHFSVSSLLAEIDKTFKPLADKKQIELILNYPIEDVYLHSDRVLLDRILRNLISNAFQYTQHGYIEVAFEQIDNQLARIYVQDTGPGIDPELHERIFSEYFQINNPERDRNKGFGLGLSIVKRLARLLETEITVNSSLGMGAKFSLKVPLGMANDQQIKQFKVSNSPMDISDLTILVVDDDASIRRALVTIGTVWGVKVMTAESGECAIKLLNKEMIIPDILLVDYRLRDEKTGIEAIEQIYDELNESIPAIIITGETSAEQLIEIEAHKLTVLHKPVDENTLKNSIFKVLNRNIKSSLPN